MIPSGDIPYNVCLVVRAERVNFKELHVILELILSCSLDLRNILFYFIFSYMCEPQFNRVDLGELYREKFCSGNQPRD